MCGRFTAKNPNLINKRFEEFDLHGPSMPARYNIGPAQLLLVITRDERNKPTAKTMKWGFVPRWATQREKPFKPRINATADKVHPMFKLSFQKRRCLVPADGFYEPKELGGALKEQHHIQLKGGEPFFLAGVYETGSNELPDTVAILTTKPNELLLAIHSRMPVILQNESAQAWLKAGSISEEELSRLSAPYPAGEMEEWPVSSLVNNWRNDGPELVVPVATGKIVEKPLGEQLLLL